jgi:hypothetical protein
MDFKGIPPSQYVWCKVSKHIGGVIGPCSSSQQVAARSPSANHNVLQDQYLIKMKVDDETISGFEQTPCYDFTSFANVKQPPSNVIFVLHFCHSYCIQ